MCGCVGGGERREHAYNSRDLMQHFTGYFLYRVRIIRSECVPSMYKQNWKHKLHSESMSYISSSLSFDAGTWKKSTYAFWISRIGQEYCYKRDLIHGYKVSTQMTTMDRKLAGISYFSRYIPCTHTHTYIHAQRSHTASMRIYLPGTN